MPSPDETPTPPPKAPVAPTVSAWSRPASEDIQHAGHEDPPEIPVSLLSFPALTIFILFLSIIGSMALSVWLLYTLGERLRQEREAGDADIQKRIEAVLRDLERTQQELGKISTTQATRTSIVERVPALGDSIHRLENLTTERLAVLESLRTQVQQNMQEILQNRLTQAQIQREMALLTKAVNDLTYVRRPNLPATPEEPSSP